MTADPSDLAVGALLPEKEQTFTAAMIAAYAQASGALGPIHVDRAFARQQGYADIVLHGQCVVALVSRVLTKTYGPGWAAGGSVSVRYVQPVVAGERLRSEVRVVDRSIVAGQTLITHDVRCLNQAERPVLVGEARATVRTTLPEPDPVPDAPSPLDGAPAVPRNSVSYDDLTLGLTGVPYAQDLTAESARTLAVALGDLNPIYFDDAAAGRAGFPGRIAPLIVLGFKTPFYASIRPVLGDEWPRRRPNLRYTFEFCYPPLVGDRLVAQAQVVDRGVQEGHRTATFQTSTFNQRGVLIGTFQVTEAWP